MLIIEIYESRTELWVWRAKDENKKVVASGKGFNTREDCRTSIDNFFESIQKSDYRITEVDG